MSEFEKLKRDENLHIPIEEYRLIFEHRYVGCDGKTIRIEDPKILSYVISDLGGKNNGDIISYRYNILREMYERLMDQMLREVEW